MHRKIHYRILKQFVHALLREHIFPTLSNPKHNLNATQTRGTSLLFRITFSGIRQPFFFFTTEKHLRVCEGTMYLRLYQTQ